MNQQQRSYAMERINMMEKEKLWKIQTKFTTPEVAISEREKIALIQKGTVKLVKEDIYRYTKLFDAFDFSKHERPSQFNVDKAKSAMDLVKKAATETKDKLMLANETEALEAIQNFEKIIKAI